MNSGTTADMAQVSSVQFLAQYLWMALFARGRERVSGLCEHSVPRAACTKLPSLRRQHAVPVQQFCACAPR